MSPLSSFSNSLAKFSHHAGKVSATPCSVLVISAIWGISLAVERLHEDLSEHTLQKKILEACVVIGLCLIVGLIGEIALQRFQN